MKQKIKNIAKAYTNSLPIGEDWYEDRLSKCVKCEFNSNNVTYNTLTAMQKVQKTTGGLFRKWILYNMLLLC